MMGDELLPKPTPDRNQRLVMINGLIPLNAVSVNTNIFILSQQGQYCKISMLSNFIKVQQYYIVWIFSKNIFREKN